jgi:hypothetical protein
MGSTSQQLSQLTDGESLLPCMICHLLCIAVFRDLATQHYTCAMYGQPFKHLYFFHLHFSAYSLAGFVLFFKLKELVSISCS